MDVDSISVLSGSSAGNRCALGAMAVSSLGVDNVLVRAHVLLHVLLDELLS